MAQNTTSSAAFSAVSSADEPSSNDKIKRHSGFVRCVIVAPCQDQDVPLLEETNFVSELPEEILIIVVNSL